MSNQESHCPFCGGTIDPERQTLCHFGADHLCGCDQIIATTTWIKIEDRKPEESGWYLCAGFTNAYGEPIVVPMWWYDTEQEFDNDPKQPTHWMPLPAPPTA